MTPYDWDDLFAADLDRRRQMHQFRQRRIYQPIDATHMECDGKRYVNFSSNNYLGLTHHPSVVEAMLDATRLSGAGSGAATLITGYAPIHAKAEEVIAKWKGTESAILLPSGYQ